MLLGVKLGLGNIRGVTNESFGEMFSMEESTLSPVPTLACNDLT